MDKNLPRQHPQDGAGTGADHSLSIEEASHRFVDAGVPRSVRTIQRYCQVGYLDCISVQGELGSRYIVSASSVENRIKELLQVQQITGVTVTAPRRVKTRYDAPQRDDTRHDAPDGESSSQPGEVSKLRDKVRILEIDNRVREQLIGRLDADRTSLLAQVVEKSHTIGKLEAELRLLGGTRTTGDNSSNGSADARL